MQPEAVRFTPTQATDYLTSLESLARELETATEAIIAGALPSLEESVARQQAECSRLIVWTELMAARRAHNIVPAEAADAALLDRILTASSILLKLNRRYSALLKHSGDTLRLLSGLSRSYHGQMEASALRTFSCEL